MNTRRTFLAGSAAVPLMAQSAARTAGANDRLRLAVIGCGTMGRGNLTQFLKIDGVDVVGLCDVDDAQIPVAQKIVQDSNARTRPFVVKDFRRVLDRQDVDAIVTAAPDHWHALHTVMACQAGKDVYVQKPLATSIGEGYAVVQAARKYGRIVQVGTQQRSQTQFQQCVDFVRGGGLGQIRQVRCYAYLNNQGEVPVAPDTDPPASVDYDLWLGPAKKRPFNPNRFHFNFRYFWDYSGGTMTDWGAHMLDIALWAMPSRLPTAVVSSGGKYGWPHDAKETPDTQYVLYEYPEYLMVWEHVLGLSHGPGAARPNEHGVMFYGSNGTAIVDRWGWEVFPETASFPSGRSTYKSAGMPRREFQSDPSSHERHFVDCVRSRKTPRAGVEAGYECLTACHLGNLALRLNRRIQWDAAQRTVVGDPEAQRLVTYQYREPWNLKV